MLKIHNNRSFSLKKMNIHYLGPQALILELEVRKTKIISNRQVIRILYFQFIMIRKIKPLNSIQKLWLIKDKALRVKDKLLQSKKILPEFQFKSLQIKG